MKFSKTSNRIPRIVYWRRTFLFLGMTVSGGAISVLLLKFDVDSNSKASFVFLSFMWSAILFNMYEDRKLKKRVLAAEGRVCTNCGYVLVGLQTEGICPECGVRYVIEACQTSWKNSGFL